MKKIKRRIIQVSSLTTKVGEVYKDSLASLCNDGTLWIAEVVEDKVRWSRFPDVPQPGQTMSAGPPAAPPKKQTSLKAAPDPDPEPAGESEQEK